jgi:hypothetical protein
MGTAGAFVPGLGFLAFLLLVYWVPLVAILIYRRDVSAGPPAAEGRALSG